MKLNDTSLDTLCGALAHAIGVEAPKESAESNKALVQFADERFGGDAGPHGLDMPEDLNITHLYKAYPREK